MSSGKEGSEGRAFDQRVNLGEQRVDLGRSINVLNTTRPANNPFVKPSNGNGSKPAATNNGGTVSTNKK